MRYGLDTNVLVYAHMPALKSHAAVSVFLTDLIHRADTVLVVAPLVLHELAHVVTDARRFDPPVPVSEASALARRYLGKTNVACAEMSEETVLLALDLVDRHRLGRKRLSDALLAATYMLHPVDAVITCDPGDFAPFGGLNVIDPRNERP